MISSSSVRLTVTRWRARRTELARQSALISTRAAELDTELAQTEYDQFLTGRPTNRAIAARRASGLRHLDAMRDARDGQRPWPASEQAAAAASVRPPRTGWQTVGDILEPLSLGLLFGGFVGSLHGNPIGIAALVVAPFVFCAGVFFAFGPRFERPRLA